MYSVLTTEFMITPQSRPESDQPSQEKRSYEVTKREKKRGEKIGYALDTPLESRILFVMVSAVCII